MLLDNAVVDVVGPPFRVAAVEAHHTLTSLTLHERVSVHPIRETYYGWARAVFDESDYHLIGVADTGLVAIEHDDRLLLGAHHGIDLSGVLLAHAGAGQCDGTEACALHLEGIEVPFGDEDRPAHVADLRGAKEDLLLVEEVALSAVDVLGEAVQRGRLPLHPLDAPAAETAHGPVIVGHREHHAPAEGGKLPVTVPA
jgi:hypothetical protein